MTLMRFWKAVNAKLGVSRLASREFGLRAIGKSLEGLASVA